MPSEATFAFATLEELHRALDRTYRLSVSLPDAPLQQFLSATSSAPRSTEAERLVIQRVGQDIFRQALMKYWNGRCPLTGITDTALLRASHIVPWSECETDAQRLNVHNGLFLSALWDAAFDAGLVSFDDAGRPLYSSSLSPAAARLLQVQSVGPLTLTAAHRSNLVYHRTKHGLVGEIAHHKLWPSAEDKGSTDLSSKNPCYHRHSLKLQDGIPKWTRLSTNATCQPEKRENW